MAREHVGDNILCVDAVLGSVAKNNRTKFGYSDAFLTVRYEGIAQSDKSHPYSGSIVKVSKSFLSSSNQGNYLFGSICV